MSEIEDITEYVDKPGPWILSNKQKRSNMMATDDQRTVPGPFRGAAVLFNPSKFLISFIRVLIEQCLWKVVIVGNWASPLREFVMLQNQYPEFAIHLLSICVEDTEKKHFWERCFMDLVKDLPLRLAMFNRPPIFASSSPKIHNMNVELWPNTMAHIDDFSNYAVEAAILSNRQYSSKFKVSNDFGQQTILMVANYRPSPDTLTKGAEVLQLHDSLLQDKLRRQSRRSTYDTGKKHLVQCVFVTMDSKYIDPTLQLPVWNNKRMFHYAKAIINLFWSSAYCQWVEIFFQQDNQDYCKTYNGLFGAYESCCFRPQVSVDPNSPAGTYLFEFVFNPFPGVAFLPPGVFIPGDYPKHYGEFYSTGTFSPANAQGFINEDKIESSNSIGHVLLSSAHLLAMDNSPHPGRSFPAGHFLLGSSLPPGTFIPGGIKVPGGIFLPGFGRIAGNSFFEFADFNPTTNTIELNLPLTSATQGKPSEQIPKSVFHPFIKTTIQKDSFVLPHSTIRMMSRSSNPFLAEYMREYSRYDQRSKSHHLSPTRPIYRDWEEKNEKEVKKLQRWNRQLSPQPLLSKLPVSEENMDVEWPTSEEVREQAELLARFKPPPLVKTSPAKGVCNDAVLRSTESDAMDLDDNASVQAQASSQPGELIRTTSPNYSLSSANTELLDDLEPIYGVEDKLSAKHSSKRSLKRKARNNDANTVRRLPPHPTFELELPRCCSGKAVDETGYKKAAKAYGDADIDRRECHLQ
jgi:hypothetical protein